MARFVQMLPSQRQLKTFACAAERMLSYPLTLYAHCRAAVPAATATWLGLQVRKTHNQGVFDAYTAEMKRARKSGILTGLPDGYGELAAVKQAVVRSSSDV
jgi:pyruvate-formate lyase